MYDVKINTSLSLLGHVVYVTYSVTKDDAVDWYLSPQEYHIDGGDILDSAISCLETLMRTHFASWIEQELLSEFDARIYEETERVSAQASMMADGLF